MSIKLDESILNKLLLELRQNYLKRKLTTNTKLLFLSAFINNNWSCIDIICWLKITLLNTYKQASYVTTSAYRNKMIYCRIWTRSVVLCLSLASIAKLITVIVLSEIHWILKSKKINVNSNLEMNYNEACHTKCIDS